MIRKVQNIYYMLAYAFQVLHEKGYRDVASEDFKSAAELLAAILCRGVSIQIKRGLERQYITREEALSTLRGESRGQCVRQNTDPSEKAACMCL